MSLLRFDKCLVPTAKNLYLNTKSRGIQLGFIVGYGQLKPVLKINEDFQYVDHELARNDHIVDVEVWGCGSYKNIKDQQDMANWENKQIDKMRTVKLNAGDWTENADKSILDMAGIKTEHSERGDMWCDAFFFYSWHDNHVNLSK